MNDPSGSTRHILIILGTALVLLFGASLVSWSDLTGDRIKDFNLLADLLPQTERQRTTTGDGALSGADPHLAELEAELNAEQAESGSQDASQSEDSDAGTPAVREEEYIPSHSEAPKIDGHVVIENYTGGPTLEKFSDALARAAERPVRVAIFGDSFIEGDIFSQDVRRLLQEQYGGKGAGYLCVHSEMPGFRNSVRQSSSGWDLRSILNMHRNDSIHTVTGEYAISRSGATATFRGNSDISTLASWNRSRAVFLAPDTAHVTMETDGDSRTFTLHPSSVPQTIEIDGTTSMLKIKDVTPGITCLGVYLDGEHGVSVDCISNRGSSGLNLRQARRSNSHVVDYDLIILEFGINAMSEQQTNYNSYGIGMKRVIEHIKELFPDADILMFGIADRGSKVNGVVRSLPVCAAMTKAQRDAARDTRIHFYDLRAAQGGENAIVSWRERGLVNADYIHLNHKGGKVMAQEFVTGLLLSIDNGNEPGADSGSTSAITIEQ